MDEYIYISNAKLRGLLPTNPRWWARMRARRVQAGVGAGVAHVGADLETDELVRQAAQIQQAERQAADTAKWYEDDTLTAGDWMFFEGRIGCHVVDMEPKPGAVLFCQIPLDTGRSVLLHGSAVHLPGRSALGSVPVSVTTPFSASAEFPRIIQQVRVSEADPLWRFWRAFRYQDPATAEADLQTNLTELYRRVVGTDWFQASAPYLSGFAYVSGLVGRPDGSELVVGSPLLVRRARPGS